MSEEAKDTEETKEDGPHLIRRPHRGIPIAPKNLPPTKEETEIERLKREIEALKKKPQPYSYNDPLQSSIPWGASSAMSTFMSMSFITSTAHTPAFGTFSNTWVAPPPHVPDLSHLIMGKPSTHKKKSQVLIDAGLLDDPDLNDMLGIVEKVETGKKSLVPPPIMIPNNELLMGMAEQQQKLLGKDITFSIEKNKMLMPNGTTAPCPTSDVKFAYNKYGEIVAAVTMNHLPPIDHYPPQTDPPKPKPLVGSLVFNSGGHPIGIVNNDGKVIVNSTEPAFDNQGHLIDSIEISHSNTDFPTMTVKGASSFKKKVQDIVAGVTNTLDSYSKKTKSMFGAGNVLIGWKSFGHVLINKPTSPHAWVGILKSEGLPLFDGLPRWSNIVGDIDINELFHKYHMNLRFTEGEVRDAVLDAAKRVNGPNTYCEVHYYRGGGEFVWKPYAGFNMPSGTKVCR